MKKLWIALVAGALLAAVVLITSRNWSPVVLTASAVNGTAVNAVTGTAEVLAFGDIDVKAQHRGTVVESAVRAGQHVAKGEILMVQDSEDLRLRMQQVEIRLRAARSRSAVESRHAIDLESLDEDVERMRISVELGQTPASRLDQLQRDRRKLEVNFSLETINDREQVALLENQLQQMQLQLEQLTTRAPFAGRVVVLKAFPGDLINSGQSLLRLVSNSRQVRLELTEEDYAGVAEGQTVVLRLASFPERSFEGKVIRLEGVADADSKTRNVFVSLEAEADLVVPGLTGEGLVLKAQREDAVLIPRRALLGNRVYVVESGLVDIRRVQPGFIGLNQVEIVSGIAAGDSVVLEEQNALRHGQRVRVEQR
jgi:RND family efflux transporter MFP subunit